MLLNIMFTSHNRALHDCGLCITLRAIKASHRARDTDRLSEYYNIDNSYQFLKQLWKFGSGQ